MRKTATHGIGLLVLALAGALPLRGQMLIKSPKKNSALEQNRIGVTVIGKPGETARLFVNGAPADSGEIRIDGKYDFLNIEVPDGPIELRAEARGAGNRLFQSVVQAHIVGPPARLKPNRELVELPADSQSTASVSVEIQDAWGYRISRLKSATIRTANGRVAEPDLDSLSAGCQRPVEDSRLAFTLRVASAVGREDLVVEAGEARLVLPVRYTTPLAPFMVVGSLDAAASVAELGRIDASVPKFTLADYTHQEGDWKGLPVSGRLAFYAKGSVLNKYQVTTSFDSRRTRDNQLFRDLDPDKQYALYGDAGTLVYDAQTQAKFYGKIERNESFLAAGDYNTAFRATEFAKYDRSFTGVYGKLQGGRQGLAAFATLSDRTQKMDEIRGEGISGYYFLSAGRITLQSDKVRLETRDRYHPEKVLRSEDLVRFQDYDINAVDGTLMFKQPVPSVDGGGNPVFIVAAYECQSGSARSLIGGLRYEGTWLKNIRLGSTLVMEQKKPSNYVLAGADATVPVAKWLELKGEYAQTRAAGFSSARETGEAVLAEVKLEPFSALEVNGYFRKVDEGFSNPSLTGGRFEMGSEKFGVDQSLRLGKFGKIQSQVYRQTNDLGSVNENRVQVANAFYEYPLSARTSAKVGYENAERRQAGADSVETSSYRSKMIKAQLSHKWAKRFATTLEHEQNLAEGKTTLPTGSAIGLSFDLTEKIQLFLKQRLLSGGRGRTQTIFGIDSRLNKSTQMSGKYEIGGASGEALSRATIGLKNRWAVRKDLTLNLAFESTATMDSLEVPTPEHSAASAGFEYLPDRPWKSSGKFEYRLDRFVSKRVVALGSEFKILHGLSAIGRLDWAGARYLKKSGDVWNRSDLQWGIAFRPERSDALNGIAKVQWLSDKNTHVAPKTRLDRFILSMHGYWQPHARIEFGGRVALRRLLDEEMGLFSSTTLTSLASLRTELTWHSRWSTGLDLRWVGLSPADQAKVGFAADVNHMLKQNMQVGLGYVFKNLSDPDFSYSEYSYSNFYLVLRMKFSEDVFDWR